MKKKVINVEDLYGRIYEHNLAIKTVQNKASANFGKEFLNGTLSIATDDECLNVVDVHFSYVTEKTKNGGTNNTYVALKKIIDSGKTVLLDGKENATTVRCQPALALNDFYSSRNGEEQLVSAKRNEGGFVTIGVTLPENEVSKRSTFDMDMLITGTQYIEADEEKNIAKDYVVLKGYVFDFKNAILPVEFVVKNADGIKYFESLEVSQKSPIFTRVKGTIESQTIVRKVEEEGAFGEPSVKEYKRTVREWVVDWTAKEPYPLGDEENGITGEELKKALADREVYLADIKKRQDEYQASRSGATAGSSGSAPLTAASGAFDF